MRLFDIMGFSSTGIRPIETGKTTISFVDEYVYVQDSIDKVIEKLNESDRDIVRFGDIAINRRNVLYVGEPD